MSQKEAHGLLWPEETAEIDIEMTMIRNGGFMYYQGQRYGAGLFGHYRNLFSILWPDDDHHRWSDLALRRICGEEIVVLMGSSDSNKTYSMARFVMADYWTFPNNTLWMVSSTELRGADLRIWGKIKELYNRGKERFPHLAGTPVDYKNAITTDVRADEQDEARTLTRGIVFIPCKSEQNYIGLGAYMGIKPTRGGRLGHAGDEVSVMNRSFLDAYANWYGKENFKGLLSGNPLMLDDPLCIAAEPEEGWDAWEDSGKTQEWRSRFYKAWVIAFDGRDSPNMDQPEDLPAKFPYMIGHKKIKAVRTAEGEDSVIFHSQCVGKPRKNAEVLRVISRLLCRNGKVAEKVVWGPDPTTHVLGNDAAYGGVGGDRCTGFHLEFGLSVEGKILVKAHPRLLCPVSVSKPILAEDQIAHFFKDYAEQRDIPPENFFFDARATLAIAFARIWSPNVNAVDFGGQPTKRPVSSEEFVWEGEEQKRLKRCDEHYSKFVTELWFTIRYLILGQQLREVDEDTLEEGYRRMWKYVAGNKIEVETKADMKKRTKQSPDYFDALVTAVEGARRRGLIIDTIRERSAEEDAGWTWLRKEMERNEQFLKRHELGRRR